MTDDPLDDLDDIGSLETDLNNSTGGSRANDHTDIAAGPTRQTPGDTIGHVVLAESELYVGREDQSVSAYIERAHRDKISVGSYLAAPVLGGDQDTLLSEVQRLEHVPKSDVNDLVEGGQQNTIGGQNIAYLARLDPIAIVSGNGANEWDRGPIARPPEPGAPVTLVENIEMLRTGLNIPSHGIYLGDIAVQGARQPSSDTPVDYRLFDPNTRGQERPDGEPVIFRHLLISGSTGIGKTHFTKNILRQLAVDRRYEVEIPPEEETERATEQRRLTQVVIDPEDEYVQMRDDSTDLTDAKRSELDRRDGQIAYDGIEDLAVFAPSTASTESRIDGAKSFSIPFRVVKGSPQLLFSTEPRDTTRMKMRSLINTFFNKHSPEEQTFSRFKEWFDATGEALIENQNVRAAIDRRVKAPTHKSVFDAAGTDLIEYADRMFKPGQTTVIPTGHLGGKEEKFIVLSLLTYIVRNKIQTGDKVDTSIKGQPLVVAVDEAHEYLSSTSRPREQQLVSKFREVARRGRKYQLGMVLITQNPQDIDDGVRSQINTGCYLALQPEVVDKISTPPGTAKRISMLDQGEAIINAPEVPPVEVKGLDDCLTAHD